MREERSSTTFSRRPWQAFSLIELLIVFAVLTFFAAILLPALSRAKARSSRINCTNSMKQIGLAFRSWALDNADRFPMHISVTNGGTMELTDSGRVFSHFQVMSNELSTPKILVCPQDEKRRPATNWAGDFDNTTLSYFVGLDASEGSPSSILSGDRNLTNQPQPGHHLLTLTTNTGMRWTKEQHFKKGNITFGDGSVRSVANNEAHLVLQMLGAGTNRVVVPWLPAERATHAGPF